jgi:hypothetical protein
MPKSCFRSLWWIGLFARPGNGGHKAVATSRFRRDVSSAVLSVAERLAQAGDVKPQAAFFDCDARPDLSHQVVLADDLIGARQKRQQDVKGPPAEFHRYAVLRQ